MVRKIGKLEIIIERLKKKPNLVGYFVKTRKMCLFRKMVNFSEKFEKKRIKMKKPEYTSCSFMFCYLIFTLCTLKL